VFLRKGSASSIDYRLDSIRSHSALLATTDVDKQEAAQTTKEQTPLKALPESLLDVELESVNGKGFKLSNYSGKVLVLNLWATWCGPCRFETPMLVKLQKEFRSKGVRVVELSTEDPINSAESVRRWVRQFGVNYKVGWAPRDIALILMQGRDAIPQSFVISRDARIVRRFIGFNPTETASQMKDAIKEALK
jgi:thiol-disulfide isomerase/thioredoxin